MQYDFIFLRIGKKPKVKLNEIPYFLYSVLFVKFIFQLRTQFAATTTPTTTTKNLNGFLLVDNVYCVHDKSFFSAENHFESSSRREKMFLIEFGKQPLINIRRKKICWKYIFNWNFAFETERAHIEIGSGIANAILFESDGKFGWENQMGKSSGEHWKGTLRWPHGEQKTTEFDVYMHWLRLIDWGLSRDLGTFGIHNSLHIQLLQCG